MRSKKGGEEGGMSGRVPIPTIDPAKGTRKIK